MPSSGQPRLSRLSSICCPNASCGWICGRRAQRRGEQVGGGEHALRSGEVKAKRSVGAVGRSVSWVCRPAHHPPPPPAVTRSPARTPPWPPTAGAPQPAHHVAAAGGGELGAGRSGGSVAGQPQDNAAGRRETRGGGAQRTQGLLERRGQRKGHVHSPHVRHAAAVPAPLHLGYTWAAGPLDSAAETNAACTCHTPTTCLCPGCPTRPARRCHRRPPPAPPPPPPPHTHTPHTHTHHPDLDLPLSRLQVDQHALRQHQRGRLPVQPRGLQAASSWPRSRKSAGSRQ